MAATERNAFIVTKGAASRHKACGCELVVRGAYTQVYQCPMHAAAEELLAALEAAHEFLDGLILTTSVGLSAMSAPMYAGAIEKRNAARIAIAKARGQ